MTCQDETISDTIDSKWYRDFLTYYPLANNQILKYFNKDVIWLS